MKGLTHFMAGVTVASCFPAAVNAGADGNPLYFILGGLFGLLPDTIDFKFGRFFARRDMEVTPDPLAPDPQMIADAVAYAVNRAWETGRPVRIKLNTIRLGADRWRQYRITFEPARRRVTAAIGPAVTTGQTPLPGAAPANPREACAQLVCPLAFDYLATTTIDIFEGPLFVMTPTADQRVRAEFIPWHRSWSHSVLTAAGWGALAGLLFGPLAALIAMLAYDAHIAVDQLGFMGSNLLFPFRRRRSTGLQLVHSGEALPNFSVVWVCCLLIFWNLGRRAPLPLGFTNLVQMLGYGALLPLALWRWLLPVCSRTQGQ
jgi:membrane-bound metal-dependent hydrolase YbcI (DUF457 family)